MVGISHNEVRRHPRWREELKTPLHTSSNVERLSGMRLLSMVGLIVVVIALLVVALN